MMDMVFNLMWMVFSAFVGVLIMALCAIASDESDEQ